MKSEAKRTKKSKSERVGVTLFTYEEAHTIEHAIDGRRALGIVELFELDECSCKIVIIPGASLDSIRNALSAFGASIVSIDGDEFNRVRVVRAS